MKKLIDSTLRLAGIVLLSMVWMACDSAGDDEGADVSLGNLSGVVREEGAETPLPEITVALDNVEATTDTNGRFEFREVPVGFVTLEVKTTGFIAYTKPVEVLAGDNSLDISLVRRRYYEHVDGQSTLGIYLPPGVSTYRGVIFQAPFNNRDTRGFASGIPRTSPPPGLIDLNEFVAAERQRSWRLAEKYGLALMGAEIEAPSHARRSAVLPALVHFAEESGHPELAQAPLLMMGVGDGGCLGYRFTLDNSDRVIGFITQIGSTANCLTGWSDEVRRVPGYLFNGEFDQPVSRIGYITQLFEENRSQGALWALAVQPDANVTPVCDQDLLFNWMDVVLESRLPETVLPGAPVALKALDEGSGWLGHQGSFSTAAYASYTEDKLQASWLPSRQAAQDWQAFVSGVNTTVNCSHRAPD